jgi:alkanesulfonate monooxygenase SsuD/methylene tetrahydromethanopterin reductase-like flavin-dependent oxidoreductase (luciferase family)
MRLRFASAVLLSFNHPIRIAERLAVLDLLSDGRAELGTARSNNPFTLSGFGVDPKTTRAQWQEAIEIIVQGLSTGTFEYSGEVWTIPERPLVPMPKQRPHPPISVSATSLETHRNAGRLGFSAMSGFGLVGWDYVQECVNTYKQGIAEAKPPAGVVNDCSSCFVALAHCAPTDAEAKEQAREAAFRFVDVVSGWFHGLSAASPDYEYFKRISEIEERRRDLDHLVERSPYLSIGTPEFLVERFRRLHEMGFDEIIMRVDGMGHDRHVQTIELIGKEVLPQLPRSRG